jgi:D-alanyl-lipoteichoic acid acyltransferase DltB (MBOAT superfamily)
VTFISLEFWVFMSAVYVLYRLLPLHWQNRMLLVASYIFYGWWDWRFLSLIWISTIFDFLVGLALGGEKRPRARVCILLVSLFVNLGLLGFFKYFNFFAESMAVFLGSAGFTGNWTTLNIILPIGISFYTFQSMTYTIDIYRGKLQATRRFLDFALFVTFFPQLMAGPIERAANLLPRLMNTRTITMEQSSRGVYLILLGLFKKVAIADGLAPFVNAVYNSSGAVSWVEILLATYLFAFQIYCDFSGYSDIARGLAKLLGIELMTNFNLPYMARNPREFWSRWHISLSTWLRDYLYISLGGNRGGRGKTYRNLMLTMVLGGLWHGAAWNFVLWGFYHGVCLCLHRVFAREETGPAPSSSLWQSVRNIASMVLFFHITCYGWLLFRANSFAEIARFTWTLFTGSGGLVVTPKLPSFCVLAGLPLLLLLDSMQYFAGTPHFYQKWQVPLRAALYASLIFVLLTGLSNESTEFIYFQF